MQSLPELPWQPSVFRRQPSLSTVTEVTVTEVTEVTEVTGTVVTVTVTVDMAGIGATGIAVTTITAALAFIWVLGTATGILRITADTAAITAIAIAFTHLAVYTSSDLLSPLRQMQQASKFVYLRRKASTGCKE